MPCCRNDELASGAVVGLFNPHDDFPIFFGVRLRQVRGGFRLEIRSGCMPGRVRIASQLAGFR